MNCPKCGTSELTEGNIGYEGCITDEGRYGESKAWNHDGYQCNKCKIKFTIWDEYDDFIPDEGKIVNKDAGTSYSIRRRSTYLGKNGKIKGKWKPSKRDKEKIKE